MPALTNADRQRLFRERRRNAAAPLAAPAAVPGDAGRDTEDVPQLATTGAAVTEASPDLGVNPAPGGPPADRDGGPEVTAAVTFDPPAARYMTPEACPALSNDGHAAAPAVRGDNPTSDGPEVTVALCPAELARLDSWRACQPGHPGRAAALRLLVLAALHMPATA